MRGGWLMLAGLMMMTMASGCAQQRISRVATRLEEVPRVDLDLSSGNRGYLIGHAPTEAELKTTRQMVHTDIEIPSLYRAKHGGTPIELDQDGTPVEPSAAPAGNGQVTVDTYVVKRGESLWKISARPEIYGNGNAWRRIYNANQELLKRGPDSLREGMTLRIPRGDDGVEHVISDTDEDEGMRFKK